MDLLLPLSHPLEFLIYIFLPAWVLLFTIKLSRPDLANKINDIEKKARVLGKPLDRIIFVSIFGFVLYVLFGSICLAISHYSSSHVPLMMRVPHLFGAVLWTMMLILIVFNLSLDIFEKKIKKSLTKDNKFSDRSAYLIFSMIFSILFLILSFIIIDFLSDSQVSPIGYVLHERYPFSFYAKCNCDNVTMISTLNLLNPTDTPIMIYGIKKVKGTDLINVESDPSFPQILKEKENISFTLTINRENKFDSDEPIFMEGEKTFDSDEFVFMDTNKGTFYIHLECNKIITDKTLD